MHPHSCSLCGLGMSLGGTYPCFHSTISVYTELYPKDIAKIEIMKLSVITSGNVESEAYKPNLALRSYP